MFIVNVLAWCIFLDVYFTKKIVLLFSKSFNLHAMCTFT